MDEAAANRRRLGGPSNALTTAEIYAQKHGIPAELNSALLGVGMRIRQAASTGRANAFSRTQSTPILHFGGQSNQSGGFITHQQAVAEAQAIISKEQLRQRELKPFSSNDSDDLRALDLPNYGNRQGSPDRFNRKLNFGPDGTVTMDGERRAGSAGAPDFSFLPGRKRGKEEADAEEGGQGEATDGDDDDEERTEVDEDEAPPTMEDESSATLVNNLQNEFPPVFKTPEISHPALFDTHTNPGNPNAKGLMLPPPVPAQGRRRKFAPNPNRSLHKTVSAPIRLGGMDVDMDGGDLPDGFDVSEWAKAEPQ